MLAISRALLTNPRLLIMDEPTEGLAPVIVAQVEEMLVRLGEDGDMAVLVIEQNIGVATAIAENVAIMVNGRVNRIIDSRAACRRPRPAAAPARRRPPRRARADSTLPTADAGGDGLRRARRGQAAPIRIYISNPTPPTRWSQPVPIARIEAAARTRSAGVARLDETAATPRAMPVAAAQRPPGRARRRHARHQGRRSSASSATSSPASGLRTRLVDVSTSGKPATCDVSAQEIALNHGARRHRRCSARDRGASVDRDGRGLRQTWLRRQSDVAGMISAGGSGGASLVAPAMRALPIGVPKLHRSPRSPPATSGPMSARPTSP